MISPGIKFSGGLLFLIASNLLIVFCISSFTKRQTANTSSSSNVWINSNILGSKPLKVFKRSIQISFSFNYYRDLQESNISFAKFIFPFNRFMSFIIF